MSNESEMPDPSDDIGEDGWVTPNLDTGNIAEELWEQEEVELALIAAEKYREEITRGGIMSALAKSFIAAKKAFSPALKDKNNPAYKSKYADLGACLDAVNDALLANGIAMYQETFEDANGVTVETVLLHEAGETLRCGKLHVPADKQTPQGYGSALTYCRRYSLMTACGIAPEDDDGNAASMPAKRTEQTATPLNYGSLTAGQIAEITALASEVGVPTASICKTYSVQSLINIQNQAYSLIIERLQSKRKSA